MNATSQASSPLRKQQTLATTDGHTLFVQTFEPQQEILGTVLVVHGYLEHGGRYAPLADSLNGHGLRMVVADLRGHGRSSGARGHVDRFQSYRRDMFDVLTAAQLMTGPKPVFVLGHSLGGLISLDYALTKAPKIAGLVLTNPFISPALKIPWAKLWLGKLTQSFWPGFAVRAGLDPQALTRDETLLQQAQADPLIFDRTTARWFHEVTHAQKRVRQGGALAMPFLGILGMADAIADPKASLECFAELHAPDSTLWQRAGERHEVLNELDRKQLHQQIAQWMLARL